MTGSVYGRQVVQKVTTFLGTHSTFGGTIQVVIVQDKPGPLFFFCTDVNASVAEMIERFADRAAVEQIFHDVKEIWGSGRQQVRNLWISIAVRHLNLWSYTLSELWA